MTLPLAILGIGPTEAIIIVVLVLVLFGGTKIPELMRGVGRGVGELQKGLDEGKRTMHDALREDEKKKQEEYEERK